MPKELKQRMQDYFQTVWSLNHGIDIHEVKYYAYIYEISVYRKIKINKFYLLSSPSTFRYFRH